jgi:hypothetical protein
MPPGQLSHGLFIAPAQRRDFKRLSVYLAVACQVKVSCKAPPNQSDAYVFFHKLQRAFDPQLRGQKLIFGSGPR